MTLPSKADQPPVGAELAVAESIVRDDRELASPQQAPG
jgi:hypothetical protein